MKKKQCDVVLDYLLNGDRNVLLIGGGGTGKSTLIRKWMSQDPTVMAIAPTGIASINLGMGCATAHSSCGIPISPNLYDHIHKNLYPKISLIKRDTIKNCTALLLEEISMIRADVLDYIDYVFKKLRSSVEPFGGVRLVFVGDPFQLPPVVAAGDGLSKHWFFDSFVWENIDYVRAELTEVHRQTDRQFIDTLSRMRIGTQTNEDIDYINTRVGRWDQDCMVLASTNSAVDDINNYKLDVLDTESFTSEMMTFGSFRPKDVRAPEILDLKIGARVVFVKNKYTLKGETLWVNGTTGKVHAFKGDIIQVKIDGGNIVDVSKESWEKVERQFKNDEWEQVVKGSCTQYPLRLGFASTIHSAQSLTLSKFFLKNGDIFSVGQLYTAISRAVGPKSITLEQHVSSRDIRVDESVKLWHKRHFKQKK